MKQFSLLTTEKDKCFLCGVMNCIEHHHIFGGANRKKSTVYGLVVPLCHWCHNVPPHGVHHNKANREKLQRIAQSAAMERYGWSIDDFRKIFGKNYL